MSSQNKGTMDPAALDTGPAAGQSDISPGAAALARCGQAYCSHGISSTTPSASWPTLDQALVGAAGHLLLGVGTDLVHVPTFAQQLAVPGTQFSRVFTDREWAAASAPGKNRDASLAGRWAVKESVIKAWSEAVWGDPPPVDASVFDWRTVEVIQDRWGRPAVELGGSTASLVARLVAQCFSQRFSGGSAGDPPAMLPRWCVSLSHDGDYALAFVTLLAVPASS